MLQSKRIIVGALNWGLGHASRCIPIINLLIEQGNTVAIASDGDALTLLQETFPDLKSFQLPSYNISYQTNMMAWNIISQSPYIFETIIREQNVVDKIAQEWRADIIISDNRLGLRSKHTYNIYVTHQLSIPIKNKWYRASANLIHHQFINKFKECWIPDFKGDKSLAGMMTSPKLKIPKRYIGPISRIEIDDTVDKDIEILVILSGPEPQRTKLESLLIQELTKVSNQKNIHIIRGSSRSIKDHPKDITMYDLVFGEKMNELFSRARLIITRSGYSSLMDLATSRHPAILIPTPGQYEQEYLATLHDRKDEFTTVQQQDIPRKLIDIIGKME